MTRRTNHLGDDLYRYLLDVSLREPDVLRRLREETAALPDSNMQIGPEQGQFMGLLVELIGAKYTLEVGTFTGYSALVVAMALPFDGRVIACDLSEEWTSIGKPFWEEAAQAHKIELRLGPAVDSLDGLIAQAGRGTSTSRSSMPTRKGIRRTSSAAYSSFVRGASSRSTTPCGRARSSTPK